MIFPYYSLATILYFMPTRYKPIHSSRLYEQIVEQIENGIISGDLKVGDQLPTEHELTQQFGVSRTAVREAMKALSQKGLIEIQPGRGTFVKVDTLRSVRNSLDTMIKLNRDEGIRSIVGIREILEPEIAAIAAKMASEEQIKLMRESIANMDDSFEDPDKFVENDLDFHLAIAEATQNPIIPILIDSLVDILREQRIRIAKVEGGLKRGQYHHKRILQAIVDRDSESARIAMREHIHQVRQDGGNLES